MKNLKRNMLKSMFFISLLTFGAVPAYASSVDTSVVGGWDEDTGYFINADAYNRAVQQNSAYRSNPTHKGERQRKDSGGNTYYRAHGTTSWPGKRHYTRKASGSCATN